MKVYEVHRKAIADLANTREVRAEVAVLARRIQADAQRRAPKRTGRLRRSIEVADGGIDALGQQTYRVGWDPRIAYYGPMVESGTKYTRAQPHLKPAAERFEQR